MNITAEVAETSVPRMVSVLLVRVYVHPVKTSAMANAWFTTPIKTAEVAETSVLVTPTAFPVDVHVIINKRVRVQERVGA